MFHHTTIKCESASQQSTDAPGTRAYRARHISMLWTAQLWHEAIMVAAAAVSVGFMLYALRPVLS
jgi:hypothetical protein